MMERFLYHMFLLAKHPALLLVIIISVLFLTLFSLPAPTEAAELEVAPATNVYFNGEEFTVQLIVAPSELSEAIEGVRGKITFDSNHLIVSNIQSTDTIDAWTVEPRYIDTNNIGTIEFAGNSDEPITERSVLFTVTLTPVGNGTAEINLIDGAALLVADTESQPFTTITTGVYSIISSSIPASPGEPAPPVLVSPTFTDETKWYSVEKGVFGWSLPANVEAVAIEVTPDSDNQPQTTAGTIFTPPLQRYQLDSDELGDGVNYLSVNFRDDTGWGEPRNFKIQIDTTAPQPFVVTAASTETNELFPRLYFTAEDELSGVAFYEIHLDDTLFTTVTPSEVESGYSLDGLTIGSYMIEVIAVDAAGNRRSADNSVLLSANTVKPNTSTSLMSLVTPSNLLLLALLLLLGVTLLYLMQERHNHDELERRLRREITEIKDQTAKIFSALREEIHDQIISITKRKKLTKKEEEAVKSLITALEVSEKLIDKEVNDVAKTIK